MKLDHQITPYARINSIWIKYLNVSPQTIKILDENIGSKISDISRSNIFSNRPLRAKEIKEKSKWDYIKLKSFFKAKEAISNMKRVSTVWENRFANDTLDKGLISKMFKELTQLHTRNTSNPI